MAKALIVVDVQNDFITGTLPVRGGADAARRIAGYIQDHRDEYDQVISTQDWHIDPHTHFEEWPAHCVANTFGADLHLALRNTEFDYQVRKGHYNAAYSGFEGFGTNGWTLESYLQAKGIDAIDIVGLAFDFCVKETALDAVKLGLTVRVLRPYTAEITPAGGNAALAELNGAGVEVVNTAAMVKEHLPHFAELVKLIHDEGTKDRGRDIVLSNGTTTRTYLDVKAILSSTAAMRLGAQAMNAWLDYFDIDYTAIGGPGLGAYAVALTTAMVQDNGCWFNIRDKVKDHGMRKAIEGAELGEGDRVIVTDDVANSGDSLVAAVHQLRELGVVVVAVVPMVDRTGVAGARINELGLPYLPLITHEDLGLPAMEVA